MFILYQKWYINGRKRLLKGPDHMEKFYNVKFHTVDGATIIKRGIVSAKTGADIWHDAVESYDDDFICLKINDKTLVDLRRTNIVRIVMTEVDGPIAKREKQRDEIRAAVNTLAEIGL